MMTSKGRVNIFLEDEDEEEEGEILNSSLESSSGGSNNHNHVSSSNGTTTSTSTTGTSTTISLGSGYDARNGNTTMNMEVDEEATSSSIPPTDGWGQLTSKWFFTPEALANTPSILRGMTPKEQDTLRKAGIAFIVRLHRDIQISKWLLVHGDTKGNRDVYPFKNDLSSPPARVICSAAVYFHRFFVFHPFQIFHPYEIATTCYYLASKAEEVPQTILDLLRYVRKILERHVQTGTVFDRIIPPGATEELFNEVKSFICIFENILLQTISFEVAIEHPFNYHAAKCMAGFRSTPAEVFTRLKRRLHYYYEQSLNTTICLQWNARTYAMALVILACNKERVPVRIWQNLIIKSDYYIFEGFTITRATLRKICDILNSYSSSKNEPYDAKTCIKIIWNTKSSCPSSTSTNPGDIKVSLNPEDNRNS